MSNIRRLIFGFLITSTSMVYGQVQKIEFEHLTMVNGLSSDIINCFLKDRNGFLWIGTENGLNKFDGYTFKIYKNIPQDSTSLIDDAVTSLLQDKHGNIWVGTKGGLVQYIPEKDAFQINHLVFKDETISLYEDEKGDIFASCHDSLYQMAYDKNNTLRLTRKILVGTSIVDFESNSKSPLLWILTDTLGQYNTENGKLSKPGTG